MGQKYLGKKGPVNQAMGYLRLLPNEDKPKLGATVNEVRDLLEEQCREFKGKLAEQEILNQMGVTGCLRRHRTGNA